ncbi:MAG: acyltransferase [Clostridium sp.]|nr:acyltransferase [Clostridium sp.]MCM1540504.1 acyltransferase [Blautia sp.]
MQKSDRIYILKGLSIVSVVCAHIAYDTSECFTEQIALNLLNTIGSIGVIVFLLIAGYLFSFNQDSYAVFWKKKWRHLVLPWIFCGTLVYLQCFSLWNFHNWDFWFEENIKAFDLKDYITYLVGGGSFYYYMTMLLFCFSVFGFINREKNVSLYIIIMLIWIFFMRSSVYNSETPYMDPKNWVGYFGVGIYLGIRWKPLKERFQKVFQKTRLIIVAFDMFLLIYLSYKGYVMSYWNKFFLPFIILQVMGCWHISIWIENKTRLIKRILIEWGKDSFYIYLLHMLIQSVPVKYLSGFGAIGILVRPFFMITLVDAGIRLFRFMIIKFGAGIQKMPHKQKG